jgi:hypothetical protein
MGTLAQGSAPIRYTIARTEADITQVAQLWRAIYIKERQWLRPSPHSLVHDDYHECSTYLLARSGCKAVGTVRLVMDSETGLPVERFLPLGPLKRPSGVAEAQRLMVAAEARHLACRGAPFGVWAGLVKACVHLCFAKGISHVVADVFTERSMIAKFRALGFEKVGDAFVDGELDESSTSVAMLLTLEQLLKHAYQRRDRFFSYLFAFDPAFEFYAAIEHAPYARIAGAHCPHSAGVDRPQPV